MISYSYPTSDQKPQQWLGFLNKIFAGDKELISFIQRLLGYSLIGEQLEQIFPIFYGTGANGKSTLVGTVLAAFGEYGMALGESYLVKTKAKQHSTEIMDLHLKRIAVQAETDEGARLDESRVKQQTGNDMIRGRQMHQDSWEFKPSHTLLLETNHKPRIVGT